MGKVSIEQVQHERWGRCVLLRNGSLELKASLDFGPRIIHVSALGGKNLFYEDTEDHMNESGDAFEPVGGGEWHLYAGHRFWTSPERDARTTYPDNNPVEWQPAGENGVILKAEPERWNQVVKEIEIQLEPEGPHVKVIHRVTNLGPWPIRLAPWALSVMDTGGRAIVPLSGSDTGLLPNRRFILWSYTRINDPRVTFTESEMIVDQGEGPSPYKVGVDNELGWAACSVHGDTFIKRYQPVKGGNYPDFGVSFELYTNDWLTELETLGELQELDTGDTAEHVETWEIVKGLDLKQVSPEEAVAKLAPYVASLDSLARK